jgi:hypothetical protein
MPKLISPKGSKTEQRISQNKKVNQTPSDSGLLHTDNWIDQTGIQFNNASNEKVISALIDLILLPLVMERREAQEPQRLT